MDLLNQGLTKMNLAINKNHSREETIAAFKAKADTHNNAIWAPTLNKYVAISRLVTGGGTPWRYRRVVTRSESKDFLSDWSDIEVVMDGGPDFQIYSNAIF